MSQGADVDASAAIGVIVTVRREAGRNGRLRCTGKKGRLSRYPSSLLLGRRRASAGAGTHLARLVLRTVGNRYPSWCVPGLDNQFHVLHEVRIDVMNWMRTGVTLEEMGDQEWRALRAGAGQWRRQQAPE